MNGKSRIIERILADADAKCAEIAANAQMRSDKILAAANDKIVAERQAFQDKLTSFVAESARNKKSNAQLEARKYKLACKQSLVEDCYADAVRSLVDLDAKAKGALFAKLLTQYAEKGETVRVCQGDAAVLNQRLVDSVGKDLRLAAGFAYGSGGFVLEGEGYDKDLTFETLVAEIRPETEAKVAEILFGEGK